MYHGNNFFFLINVYNTRAMTINRLFKETSPYLKQHENNPVDWYPWTKEALDKAKKEKKPILLSIGYSACHWCHVMAHESFEDQETASIMNKYFVNIKVDREERPDLDKIYQTSQILLNQRSGGWPLTMFLCHENQVPFFGGTYFPNSPKYNLPSFKDLLLKINEYYTDNYNEILNHNESIITALNSLQQKNDEKINKNIENEYIKNITKLYDPIMGGFGGAPKFPQTSLLMHIFYLNDYKYLEEENKILKMAINTLEAMQEGGINDQLGGGFYRYSVDELWMIPHFEKMLYDNACLIDCFAKASVISKKNTFLETSKRTADWIINEMQDKNGGFYSSIDADSEGSEGKYYTWDKSEIKKLLHNNYEVFSKYYGLDKKPNFENRYHLFISYGSKKDFKVRKKIISELDIRKSKDILLKERERRIKPFTDKKILTSWNALTINALLNHYKLSQDISYLKSAKKAIEFIIKNMFIDNNLYAIHKDKKTHIKGYLDDYVLLINALLNFLSIQWDKNIFNMCISLSNLLIKKFFDTKDGGFFFTANDHENLIQKPKPCADEALPSGNSFAAQVLLRVGFLTNNTKYIDTAHTVFSYASNQVNHSPNSHSSLLNSHLLAKNPFYVVIIKTKFNNKESRKWHKILMDTNKSYIDYYFIDNEEAGHINLDNKILIGNITAYICKDFSCEKPITSYSDFVSRIKEL